MKTIDSFKIAIIFVEPTGRWHVSPSGLDYLDARGCAYRSRREAIASLRYWGSEYTHYRSDTRIVKL